MPATLMWTIRTKVQSSVYCFLPQLIPRLDDTKIFFSEFSDSGKLPPPPRAVKSRNYIKI